MSETGDRPEQPPGANPSHGADPGAPMPPSAPSNEERQWALFAHLSALAGFVIPFGNLIGPLVVWQIKKNEMPFVDEQGKEAVNFQITVTIAVLVCFVLVFLLVGIPLLILVGLAALVLTVIAAIKANAGEHYRYPMTLRLIN